MIYASQVETIPSVTREDVRRKYASLPQTRDASVIFTLYDSWGDGYWGNNEIVMSDEKDWNKKTQRIFQIGRAHV